MNWKLIVTRNLLKDLERRGIKSRIIRKLRQLNLTLKKEPEKVINTLVREPVIFEIETFKVRRMRIGNYRLFYIVDHKRKYIIFFDIKPRKKAYQRR